MHSRGDQDEKGLEAFGIVALGYVALSLCLESLEKLRQHSYEPVIASAASSSKRQNSS